MSSRSDAALNLLLLVGSSLSQVSFALPHTMEIVDSHFVAVVFPPSTVG